MAGYILGGGVGGLVPSLEGNLLSISAESIVSSLVKAAPCELKTEPARTLCLNPHSLFFTFTPFKLWGTRWRSWLRHGATSRKVAGSIPDGVIGIFH